MVVPALASPVEQARSFSVAQLALFTDDYWMQRTLYSVLRTEYCRGHQLARQSQSRGPSPQKQTVANSYFRYGVLSRYARMHR